MKQELTELITKFKCQQTHMPTSWYWYSIGNFKPISLGNHSMWSCLIYDSWIMLSTKSKKSRSKLAEPNEHKPRSDVIECEKMSYAK